MEELKPFMNEKIKKSIKYFISKEDIKKIKVFIAIQKEEFGMLVMN